MEGDTGRGAFKKKISYAIIHEIYENVNASEYFEIQLEHALENKVNYIMIEPTKLGDETALWIRFGNCLHKTAVLAGSGSMLLTTFDDNRAHLVSFPLAFIGWLSTAVYTLSWQFDPCIKYQIVTDKKRLGKIPPEAVQKLSTVTPVVLERRDDYYRKILHCSVSLVTASYWGWEFYKWYNT